jgi:RNA polymerase sigma-70 factor (ECF subfamily)
VTRSTAEVLDDWLVLAAQGGSAEAFETLAERWHRRIVAHAYRRLSHAEGAAEAAQEAWLAIARGLSSLDDPARFSSWAYRIVDRKAVDWLRNRRRSRAMDDRIGQDPDLRSRAVSPPADDPSGAPDRLEAVDRLRRELRRLPAEQQALLALFYTEGRSVRQIADALDIPEGTVKSRLFHARQQLKSRLEEQP